MSIVDGFEYSELRERVQELEEWIVSIVISEGMRIPVDVISKERFEEIENSWKK